MTSYASPEPFHTVIVPVANPETAEHLVRLGAALIQIPTGRLIILYVPRQITEKDSRLVDRLEPKIAELRSLGLPAELKIYLATSVARGILDAVREEEADLLVLGMRQSKRGEVVLGSVVETIVAVGPCDILIYRMGRRHEFSRVILPVDGTAQSILAARIGLLLGRKYETPVEAVYVKDSHDPPWEGQGRIEQSLAGLPGQETVKRSIISAGGAAGGILARIGEVDLVVIGATDRNMIERWLVGGVSGEVLSKAPGPVLLLRQAKINRGRRSLLSRITPTLTPAEQDELAWQAAEMADWHVDYAILIVVSSILATLGLLMNSPAVIIGAMLVAPLMQPLIGLAVGLAISKWRMARRAILTLFLGVSLAFLLSLLIGFLMPSRSITAEMLARQNPGWLDVGVALASGFIGAYATARKDIPAALAGVAIAAALMPPLCTVGLALGLGQLFLALGAATLFLLNIFCISLSALLVFLWLGMRPDTVPAEAALVGSSGAIKSG